MDLPPRVESRMVAFLDTVVTPTIKKREPAKVRKAVDRQALIGRLYKVDRTVDSRAQAERVFERLYSVNSTKG
jgi:hypothetical protein